MLRSVKQIENYHVVATDGFVGTVHDVYVDDERSTIRYLVHDRTIQRKSKLLHVEVDGRRIHAAILAGLELAAGGDDVRRISTTASDVEFFVTPVDEAAVMRDEAAAR